jgi:predicted type IV restriction endonuclease
MMLLSSLLRESYRFGRLLTLADYRDSILPICVFLCFTKRKKHKMSSAPPRIAELVETFDRNIETYHSQQYNETQLRREFIDPFFEELGWDVSNKQGYAQAYKEVIHEDAVKVGTATKAPDYSFRIGGVRKFFLEAKKPSINIGGDPHPAYQLRRYAWSAKLPVSILTDFEEFVVYDCQMRPKQTDGTSTARIMFLTYKDYIDKWDEIADIFSKEAVLKGSFDKFAVSAKAKRGTTTVDKEFLADLENWRRDLARIIALRNIVLSAHEINFAVQRTIDRIIFLRMCEDRGIEPYGQLQTISNGSRTYPRLCEIFEKADHKYNSGLFYFQKERGRPENPDELTLNLVIDDAPLKYILHSLYYPLCPYEFSVLSAEILGNVYEQFLGSVIQVSRGRRTKVEPKPEVKKAGGIYYTPSYIVDYIVKNTVGKLLGAFPNTLSEVEGSDYDRHCESAKGGRGNLKIDNSKSKIVNRKSLTPKQVANLRILDPACGSGSFLLGAYTYLLNYHRDWYIENDPEKWAKKKNPPIYQVSFSRRRHLSAVALTKADGDESHCERTCPERSRRSEAISDYRLTVSEKKRILLNNIFGVDIDSQAVEVTKLSLLLKVLEGENQQTLENQYRLFHERALPDLGNNIKCGNSLIGPDFFDNPDTDSSDDELQQKINAFDWKAEFAEIFAGKTGGFDAVIGNPPYIGFHGFKSEKPYLKGKYFSAKGKFDIYVTFIEKGVQVLRQNGLLGYICPTNFTKRAHGLTLRAFLSKKTRLRQICDFQDVQIFSGATNYTGIFIIENAVPSSDYSFLYKSRSIESDSFVIPQISLSETPWVFREQSATELVQKLLHGQTMPLGELSTGISEGIVTGQNSIFLLDREDPKCLTLEPELLHPCIRGKEIRRYQSLSIKSMVIYPYSLEGNHTKVISEKTLKSFPNLWSYLNNNRKNLSSRKYFNESSKCWYELWCQRDLNLLSTKKIIVPELSDRNRFTIADKDQFYGDTVCGITLHQTTKENLLYILGLLNSQLIEFYFKNTSVPKAGGFYIYKTMFLKAIPIRTIDFDNPEDKAKHDKMVKLVDRMLDLHKKLTAAKVPDEKTKLQRQISTTDSAIDKLTYELYNLTPDEIAIIQKTS